MLIRLNDARNSLLNPNRNPSKKSVVTAELKINGVCKIENFLDEKTCDSIGAWIKSDTKCGYLTGSDWRIDKAEKYNLEIKENIFDNQDLLGIVQSYIDGEAVLQQTMAGYLRYQEGNLGSGQGWHRDSYSNQIKAMIYLSHVDYHRGPFEYVVGSHSYEAISQEIKWKLQSTARKWRETRFSDAEIDELVRTKELKRKIYTGNKGDVIIFDARGLHRGSPILADERLALTNYYIAKNHDPRR